MSLSHKSQTKVRLTAQNREPFASAYPDARVALRQSPILQGNRQNIEEYEIKSRQNYNLSKLDKTIYTDK